MSTIDRATMNHGPRPWTKPSDNREVCSRASRRSRGRPLNQGMCWVDMGGEPLIEGTSPRTSGCAKVSCAIVRGFSPWSRSMVHGGMVHSGRLGRQILGRQVFLCMKHAPPTIPNSLPMSAMVLMHHNRPKAGGAYLMMIALLGY